jgi:hypothetical protein
MDLVIHAEQMVGYGLLVGHIENPRRDNPLGSRGRCQLRIALKIKVRVLPNFEIRGILSITLCH